MQTKAWSEKKTLCLKLQQFLSAGRAGSQDPRTINFIKYYEAEYASWSQVWAFRLGLRIHHNMHHEAFHCVKVYQRSKKLLKYKPIKKKAAKRTMFSSKQAQNWVSNKKSNESLHRNCELKNPWVVGALDNQRLREKTLTKIWQLAKTTTAAGTVWR